MFQCQRCPFQADKAVVVQVHFLEHLKPKEVPFGCNSCSFRTRTAGGALAHRQEVHGTPTWEIIEEGCYGTFERMPMEEMMLDLMKVRSDPPRKSQSPVPLKRTTAHDAQPGPSNKRPRSSKSAPAISLDTGDSVEPPPKPTPSLPTRAVSLDTKDLTSTPKPFGRIPKKKKEPLIDDLTEPESLKLVNEIMVGAEFNHMQGCSNPEAPPFETKTKKLIRDTLRHADTAAHASMDARGMLKTQQDMLRTQHRTLTNIHRTLYAISQGQKATNSSLDKLVAMQEKQLALQEQLLANQDRTAKVRAALLD